MGRLHSVSMGSAFVLVMGLLGACGSDDKKSPESTGGGNTALSFNTDIAPIVKASCATSGCHGTTGTGSGANVYEGAETRFKANCSTITNRVGVIKDMPMSPGTISSANRQKILDFCK